MLALALGWAAVCLEGLLLLSVLWLLGQLQMEGRLRSPGSGTELDVAYPPVPSFSLVDVRSTKRWELGRDSRRRPTLLVFIGVACPVSLLETINQLQRKWQRELQVLLLVVSDAESQRLARQHCPACGIAVDAAGRMASRFPVRQRPFAVLIGRGRVWGYTPVRSLGDLESLVAGCPLPLTEEEVSTFEPGAAVLAG
jgi:hypothetical protein